MQLKQRILLLNNEYARINETVASLTSQVNALFIQYRDKTNCTGLRYFGTFSDVVDNLPCVQLNRQLGRVVEKMRTTLATTLTVLNTAKAVCSTAICSTTVLSMSSETQTQAVSSGSWYRYYLTFATRVALCSAINGCAQELISTLTERWEFSLNFHFQIAPFVNLTGVRVAFANVSSQTTVHEPGDGLTLLKPLLDATLGARQVCNLAVSCQLTQRAFLGALFTFLFKVQLASFYELPSVLQQQ
jgi:hypothetical protein